MRIIAACIAVVALGLSLPVQAEEAGTGSISGTVTEDGTGKPEALSGICVEAYEAPRSLQLAGRARTGTDGTYEIEALESSAYHVWFRDCRDPSTHLAEWYDDAEMRDGAESVVVAAGETIEIDAALDHGGRISGTVTDEESPDEAVEGIKVHAFHLDRGGGPTEAETDDDGEYEIVGLHPGEFRVLFFDPRPAEYYDDESDSDDADPVSVSLGEATEEIDAELTPMDRPDLAVTDLDVENVPTENDNTGEGPSTGWVREITVIVTNIGTDAAADAEDAPFWDLSVEACSPTTDACDEIAGRVFASPLEPGSSVERTYRWNALETGHLGDVTIRAEAFDWRDLNGYNDIAREHHYVVVGGTGFGVGP